MSPVTVTAVRFTDQFELIPRRIECDGTSYELSAEYKKVVITGDAGSQTLFDVHSDTYRFRLRAGFQNLQWRLVAMSARTP